MASISPTSWADFQEFVLPQHPPLSKLSSHSSDKGPVFSTGTVPFEGLDQIAQDVEFSIPDNTLVPRLKAFLSSYFARTQTVPPLSNDLKSTIDYHTRRITRTLVDSESTISLMFARFGLIYEDAFVEALALRREDGMHVTNQAPQLHNHQRGDLNIVVSDTVAQDAHKRVAVEFKNPAVLISKREGLIRNEPLTARSRCVNEQAMKVKLAMQMAGNPAGTPAEKIPARFGFFFAGYTFVVVERVTSRNGEQGLLVSPQFRVFDSDLPIFKTNEDIRSNYNASNPIYPEKFLALILAALLDDVIPGENVASPAPPTSILPAIQEEPHKEDDRDDDDDEDKDDGDADDDEDEDPNLVPASKRKRGGSGGGSKRARSRGRGTAGSRASRKAANLSIKIAGPVPRSFCVSPLWIQPRSEAEQHKSDQDILSDPQIPFPIYLETLIQGNERGRTWRGTWNLGPTQKERKVVVKFCFENFYSYFEREFAVYEALTTQGSRKNNSVTNNGTLDKVFSPSQSSKEIAPVLYAALENKEKSWKAIVLEDVGRSLGVDYWSWSELYPHDPALFDKIYRNLRKLHKFGFYHGDIEPRNVARDGRIFDFGHSTPHNDDDGFGGCRPKKCWELKGLKSSAQ